MTFPELDDDIVRWKTNFSEKRTRHFKAWLPQLIHKNLEETPKDVVEMLLNSLKKGNIDPKKVTRDQIRQHLKKIKKPKMYEHVPSIFYILTETEPFKISEETEIKLVEMVSIISDQWCNICQTVDEIYYPSQKGSRKGFLPYSYVVYKILELLGEGPNYENHFSLIKSKEKLGHHDKVWKVICEKNGWEI